MGKTVGCLAQIKQLHQTVQAVTASPLMSLQEKEKKPASLKNALDEAIQIIVLKL